MYPLIRGALIDPERGLLRLSGEPTRKTRLDSDDTTHLEAHPLPCVASLMRRRSFPGVSSPARVIDVTD